ncbi:hypothetical protein [Alkalimarinus alittae]|uniref:Uncharacterized protein n=1 Tax=Alkalimarinus alittae TaxID=2961619 RepID=A0ABY6N2D7_9ALTE|nr:hypothetical protein [Alkalimarinus alittae]UZE96275.1 hypothetical protein NKI27_00580 [Alkalimarinus alittae]
MKNEWFFSHCICSLLRVFLHDYWHTEASVMRPTQILLLILVTLLFAGSATSLSFDAPTYLEVSCHNVDALDGHDDENDTHAAVNSYDYINGSQNERLIGKSFASPAQWKRTRVTLSPLTPQAPPA